MLSARGQVSHPIMQQVSEQLDKRLAFVGAGDWNLVHPHHFAFAVTTSGARLTVTAQSSTNAMPQACACVDVLFPSVLVVVIIVMLWPEQQALHDRYHVRLPVRLSEN